MLTFDEARSRVANGAAHLDRVRPGWADAIDLGILDLSSCYRCMLGQLFGEFDRGVVGVGFNDFPAPGAWWAADDATVRHGFVLNEPFQMEEYRVLQDAWLEAITDRRLRTARVQEEHAILRRWPGLDPHGLLMV